MLSAVSNCHCAAPMAARLPEATIEAEHRVAQRAAAGAGGIGRKARSPEVRHAIASSFGPSSSRRSRAAMRSARARRWRRDRHLAPISRAMSAGARHRAAPGRANAGSSALVVEHHGRAQSTQRRSSARAPPGRRRSRVGRRARASRRVCGACQRLNGSLSRADEEAAGRRRPRVGARAALGAEKPRSSEGTGALGDVLEAERESGWASGSTDAVAGSTPFAPVTLQRQVAAVRADQPEARSGSRTGCFVGLAGRRRHGSAPGRACSGSGGGIVAAAAR